MGPTFVFEIGVGAHGGLPPVSGARPDHLETPPGASLARPREKTGLAFFLWGRPVSGSDRSILALPPVRLAPRLLVVSRDSVTDAP